MRSFKKRDASSGQIFDVFGELKHWRFVLAALLLPKFETRQHESGGSCIEDLAFHVHVLIKQQCDSMTFKVASVHGRNVLFLVFEFTSVDEVTCLKHHLDIRVSHGGSSSTRAGKVGRRDALETATAVDKLDKFVFVVNQLQNVPIFVRNAFSRSPNYRIAVSLSAELETRKWAALLSSNIYCLL